ncbi:PHP domain-containing protein [Dongshaea marina]|uniref:PHP domain-containing protein n=1 Tax=Dongshaea marina TaxID=2047966 RepID=UPI000D3E9D67|nr:PHP domain-containing protein [Dongshaea marina]
MIIDLHCHSSASDGRLEPAELARYAVEKGVGILALTDHDTTDGIEIAQSCIQDEKLPLTLVPGIELSTRWHGFEIHVVGLNIAPENPLLKTFVAEQQRFRRLRSEKICEKLFKAGFTGIHEAMQPLMDKQMVTRAHFARYIKELGVVSNIQQAFDLYLGRKKRCWVSPQWPEIPAAIEAIHQAGGSAVLAHPAGYDLSGKWIRRLVDTFSQAGGDAMEVVSLQQAPNTRQYLCELSQTFGLKGSMGSDFHYVTPWIDLGKTLYLPENIPPVWNDWDAYRDIFMEDA